MSTIEYSGIESHVFWQNLKLGKAVVSSVHKSKKIQKHWV